MKSVIFATTITVIAFVVSMGCGDDGMEQYYKDAQLKGTQGTLSPGKSVFSESVVTLNEFKTGCEILGALDFELTDSRFERYMELNELNQKKMAEWLSRFNPSNKFVSDFVGRFGPDDGYYSAHKTRAVDVMWAIIKPTNAPNTDPPDYWSNDTYWYSPDADYPPKVFCKYVSGLGKPPISDQEAQRDYEKYVDNLVKETYRDARYYLESEIGNKTHLRKYYEDVQAKMEVFFAPVSQTEFLTACELYERMGFQFHEDANDLQKIRMNFRGSFWGQEEILKQLNNFHPIYDETNRLGLSDDQARALRAGFVMLSIQNPRDMYLLSDAVPIETQKALCEYLATRQVGNSSDSTYTDDYLQEYYINVQSGIQDAAVISGIPLGGSVSRTEFSAACDFLEAMGFRHNNTNNFAILLEQEPEETLERLSKFNPPYALINQVGRNAAAALRAGVIMGAIEGDPSFPESQQKALCEYVANR